MIPLETYRKTKTHQVNFSFGKCNRKLDEANDFWNAAEVEMKSEPQNGTIKTARAALLE